MKRKYIFYIVILIIFIITLIFLYPPKPKTYLVISYNEYSPVWQEINQYRAVDINDLRSNKGPQKMKINFIGEFFSSYINHAILIYPFYYGNLLQITSSEESKNFLKGISYVNYYGYIQFKKSEETEKGGINTIAYYLGKVLGILTPFILIGLFVRKILKKRKNETRFNK